MSQHRTVVTLLTTLSSTLAKSLASQVLEDAYAAAATHLPYVASKKFGRTSPFARLGIETMKGDRAFLLDWNETSDDDLVSAGLTADIIAALRVAMSRRAGDAPRDSRFDAREAEKLTSENQLQQFLARARLSSFFHPLSRLGVLALEDLLDVTDDDLDAMDMMRIPRRRFRPALQARLPKGTTAATEARLPQRCTAALTWRERLQWMDSDVIELLLQTVRLPLPEITRLASYHGVESLEDLQHITEDMLRDIGAKPLHMRRFETARAHRRMECVSSWQKMGTYVRKNRGVKLLSSRYRPKPFDLPAGHTISSCAKACTGFTLFELRVSLRKTTSCWCDCDSKRANFRFNTSATTHGPSQCDTLVSGVWCNSVFKVVKQPCPEGPPAHSYADSSTLSCKEPHKALLSKVRLNRFAGVLSKQLGVRRICQLLELQRPDLIASGLQTLHRRRFYAAVSLYAACSTHECDDSDGAEMARKTRQALRREARARLQHQLRRRFSGFRSYFDAVAPGDRAPALVKQTVLFKQEKGLPPGPAHIMAAHGSNWTPWTTRSQPWPDTGGHGCMLNLSGRQAGFPVLRLPGPTVQKVCLNPHDHLSKQVAIHGRWRDCSQLVDEWRRPSGKTTDSRWLPGTFLELGANIGVCTMEMLLRTSARVIAFEPSAPNLFYLTKSMSMAATERPGVANRLVVFPVGAGDVPRRSTMVREKGNFGDSHISDSRDGQSMDMVVADVVDMYPVDSLFPQLPLLEPVRLMKLDVQGFECHTLGGAMSMLLSGSIQRIVAETSKMLRRQNCSAEQMRKFLRAIGYSIVTTGASGVVTGNEAATVARMNA